MKNLLPTAILICGALGSSAQYTTTWFGNNYADLSHYVGNCARSLWVSPEGAVYTASLWDEKGRNIGIYQNGNTIGAMGGNKDSQGSAIGGDGAYVFTAQQAPNSGYIGRYNRTTKIRDLLFQASTGTGDAIQGIVVRNAEVFVSDNAGNRVAVYSLAGSLLRQWPVASPGAMAIDSSGSLWVAQSSTGQLRQYSSSGNAGTVIQMEALARPSALFADSARGQLLVGDQGPDFNIKIYNNLTGTPAPAGVFGIKGGYLDGTTGLRGQTGAKRFTRIAGIGRDSSGKLYVLNNPWGGTWDLGRNGATDIHCYDTNGTLLWTLQALNFEGNAAADAATNGVDFYSGNILYSVTGSAGASYKANTVDPYRYPNDPRIRTADQSRGHHFGHMASINGRRILIANSQNADVFYSYYFNPATDGYIAIPADSFSNVKVRNGFCLDSLGDIWMSQDKTNAIQHLPLTGFSANGKPVWGPMESTPTPASIAPLNRIEYLPGADRMILAGGSTDWTLIGNQVEVYDGWKTGNRSPNTQISLSRAQAKAMSAAGNYLFVGYYAVPDIDVFDLTTGTLVLTMNSSDPNVYVGNDVDSQYGLKAFLNSTGEYLVTKDDYNASKIVLYRWKPGSSVVTAVSTLPGNRTAVPGAGSNSGLLVFPNPAGKSLRINLHKPLSTSICVRVFDIEGKLVQQSTISNTQQPVISTEGLGRGVYTLTVMSMPNKKLMGTGKFIKQ